MLLLRSTVAQSLWCRCSCRWLLRCYISFLSCKTWRTRWFIGWCFLSTVDTSSCIARAAKYGCFGTPYCDLAWCGSRFVPLLNDLQERCQFRKGHKWKRRGPCGEGRCLEKHLVPYVFSIWGQLTVKDVSIMRNTAGVLRQKISLSTGDNLVLRPQAPDVMNLHMNHSMQGSYVRGISVALTRLEMEHGSKHVNWN